VPEAPKTHDVTMTTFVEYQRSRATPITHPGQSNPSNNSNNNKRSPPSNNFLKINVDAHYIGDDHWGFGLLLRQGDGNCVGAETEHINRSDETTLTDALGLLEAIERLQIHRVIIEIDAQAIVHGAIKHKCPQNYWGLVVKRCIQTWRGTMRLH
jgi:hypothetical protein